MSKSTGIPVGSKATEAGNTKLLKAKYAMLRKDTGGFPSGSLLKNLLANAGDMGTLIPPWYHGYQDPTCHGAIKSVCRNY